MIAAMQDEVLHQMLRLEGHRPGAELDLAIALLRAWEQASRTRRSDEALRWLAAICPACITMLEETVKAGEPAGDSAGLRDTLARVLA